jgi:hypothetical protein
LLENFAERVPATNVPPSVSSVQVSNNARGNGSYAPIENTAALSVPVVSAETGGGTAGSITSSNIPAPFLAQIIGQDVPVALQNTLSNVLAAYDQLVVNSFVKYRPSDATVPPPAPAGVFGRLLAQEQPSQPVAQPQPSVAEPPQQQAQQPAPPVQAEPQIQPALPAQTAQVAELEPQPVIEKPAPQQRSEPVKKSSQPTLSSAKVAVAYLMSDARVDIQAPATVTATI